MKLQLHLFPLNDRGVVPYFDDEGVKLRTLYFISHLYWDSGDWRLSWVWYDASIVGEVEPEMDEPLRCRTLISLNWMKWPRGR